MKQQLDLILTDRVTGTRYSLGVVEGAPTLAVIADTDMALPDLELVDAATKAQYTLAVSNGALVLGAGAGPGASAGKAKIDLLDPMTKKTYALAVANGALTLTAS